MLIVDFTTLTTIRLKSDCNLNSKNYGTCLPQTTPFQRFPCIVRNQEERQEKLNVSALQFENEMWIMHLCKYFCGEKVPNFPPTGNTIQLLALLF